MIRNHSQNRRRGLTLLELMVSVVASASLLGGMASAIYLSTESVRPDNGPAQTTQGLLTLQAFQDEIRTAQYLEVRKPHEVTFRVADRDHDGIAERIRYRWSGIEGAPLLRTYNSNPEVEVLSSVNIFSLEYSTSPATRPPRVLLVVKNISNLTVQDAAKRHQLNAWGFPVTLVDDHDVNDEFDTLVTTGDVIYVSEEMRSTNVARKLKPVALGIVNEERVIYGMLGIASGNRAFYSDRISVVDTTHPITASLSTGVSIICGSVENLVNANVIASGAQTLAKDIASDRPVLVTIDVGAELYNGGNAAGRRVKLPWGGTWFDFHSLTDVGLSIMRSSIEWAAGSLQVDCVRARLQVGEKYSTRAESHINLLNAPRVPQ